MNLSALQSSVPMPMEKEETPGWYFCFDLEAAGNCGPERVLPVRLEVLAILWGGCAPAYRGIPGLGPEPRERWRDAAVTTAIRELRKLMPGSASYVCAKA
jgi:hypothetical protein